MLQPETSMINQRLDVSSISLKLNRLFRCCCFICIALSMISCAHHPKMTPASANTNHVVVLLHGLARTERSMTKMQRELAQHGYGTCNISYPSTKFPIDTLLHEYVLPAIDSCLPAGDAKLSFVAHSLGGIIVRLMLKGKKPATLDKVIMLSPPNQGSEVVDALGQNWLFKLINGPAGNELGTGDESVPNQIGPPNYPVGIITGNKSINLILSSIIPGVDDGKVSVERAKLDGMKDFLVVPHSHPFIMRSDDVVEQVLYFLEHEQFNKPATSNDSNAW